jgi:hypothetical protein
VLRRHRNLVWVAVAVAIAALCTAALTESQNSGIGVGWRNPFTALRLIMYAVGAVGVVVLGLSCHKLAGMVTSIARRFGSPTHPPKASLQGPVI